MQLDGSLFLAEFGPGKGSKAKIDHRGLKQVELAFERESVFGRYQLAPVQQPGEQALIEGGRLFGVESGQGCLSGALHAEELTPAVEGSEFLPGMMSCGKGIEFISRDKCKQLFENSAAIGHGSDLFGLYDFFAKSLCSQRALRASFSSIFMRQQ